MVHSLMELTMIRFAGVTKVLLTAACLASLDGGVTATLPQRGTRADTGHVASPPVAGAAATPTGDGATVTPAMVDAGRTIFHGQGGCFACHGLDMQGSAVAPPLNKRGKPWLAAKDGKYEAIVNVITHGVPGTIMIAHPNGINDSMVLKVAAYIWAVNHTGAKP
jgi:mono/diheme cytochrome c family protein